MKFYKFNLAQPALNSLTENIMTLDDGSWIVLKLYDMQFNSMKKICISYIWYMQKIIIASYGQFLVVKFFT